MRVFGKSALLVAAALLCLPGAAQAGAVPAAPAEDPPAPKKLFTIADDRVQESSGLAKSQKYEGIWWTVNDSGDTARIFGVNSAGTVKAVLSFKAPVRDVEAITVDREGTIYVGDIGDNSADRDFIAVYTIPEPDQLEDQQVRYYRYDFGYPDGAKDAETLLLQPETRQLYFVTKTKSGKGAFYAAPEEPSREGVNELTKYADAPSGITDGTFLPDARQVVLRSYADIATVSWGPKPNVRARAGVPLAQGESVAVGPTAGTVLVGSEGANSAVYQVQVPLRGATPTAATPPKAAAAADSGKGDSHNLRWILLGAAAFAVLIALVTFPVSHRERRERMMENARLTGQTPTDRQRRRSTV